MDHLGGIFGVSGAVFERPKAEKDRTEKKIDRKQKQKQGGMPVGNNILQNTSHSFVLLCFAYINLA